MAKLIISTTLHDNSPASFWVARPTVEEVNALAAELDEMAKICQEQLTDLTKSMAMADEDSAEMFVEDYEIEYSDSIRHLAEICGLGVADTNRVFSSITPGRKLPTYLVIT